MLEINARVSRLEGESVWVRVESPSGCGLCQGRGCGRSMFSQIWHTGEPEYCVDNAIAARPGDAVVIGLEDGALRQAVILAYGLPLASAVSLAALFSIWGDGMAALGLLLGLGLGFVIGRRARCKARPTLRRAGVAASCQSVGR